MLIGHHGFPDPLATIVTLAAFVLAAGALLPIALPGALVAIGRPSVSTARIWGIIARILGAFPFLTGRNGRADLIPQGAA